MYLMSSTRLSLELMVALILAMELLHLYILSRKLAILDKSRRIQNLLYLVLVCSYKIPTLESLHLSLFSSHKIQFLDNSDPFINSSHQMPTLDSSCRFMLLNPNLRVMSSIVRHNISVALSLACFKLLHR